MPQPIEIKGLFHVAFHLLDLCPRKGRLVTLPFCDIRLIKHCIKNTTRTFGHGLRAHKGNDQVWLGTEGRIQFNDSMAGRNSLFSLTRQGI